MGGETRSKSQKRESPHQPIASSTPERPKLGDATTRYRCPRFFGAWECGVGTVFQQGKVDKRDRPCSRPHNVQIVPASGRLRRVPARARGFSSSEEACDAALVRLEQ